MTLSSADADQADIRRATAELLAAVNAADVSRVLAVWAENGVLMPPGHVAIRGRTVIREYFVALFERARFAFEFTASEIELDANVAFEHVSYRVAVVPSRGNGPVEDAGKGLHVYRRQSDGTWKLYADIWNSDRSTMGARLDASDSSGA